MVQEFYVVRVSNTHNHLFQTVSMLSLRQLEFQVSRVSECTFRSLGQRPNSAKIILKITEKSLENRDQNETKMFKTN